MLKSYEFLLFWRIVQADWVVCVCLNLWCELIGERTNANTLNTHTHARLPEYRLRTLTYNANIDEQLLLFLF